MRNPRLPKLTPRIGTSSRRARCGRPCRCSVPSPPSTTIRSQARRQIVAGDRRPARRQPGERRGVGFEDRVDAARLEPAGRARQDAGGRIEPGLGDQSDPCDRHARSRVAAHLAWRRWMQELEVAFHAGDRRLGQPGAPNPSASAAAATSSTTRAWTAGSRTIPPLPTSSRPASNCGLTSATMSALGREQRRHDRQDVAERDERHVDRHDVERAASRGQVAGREVRALTRSTHDDARIAPQLPVELAVADVERDDARARRAAAARR